MAHEALPDRSVGRSSVAVAAGVTGLVVDAIYLGIILQEGDTNAGRVGAFSILVGAFSLFALVSGLASSMSTRSRLVLLGASIGGLLTAGILGIFSIGLPLLIAGVLCCVAWGSIGSAAQPVPNGTPTLSVLAGIGAGTALLLGIVLT
jgi:hypothetical protein